MAGSSDPETNKVSKLELAHISTDRKSVDDGAQSVEIMFELRSEVPLSGLQAFATTDGISDLVFLPWTGVVSSTEGTTTEGYPAAKITPANPGRYVVRYTAQNVTDKVSVSPID